jgi:hypothetical protein
MAQGCLGVRACVLVVGEELLNEILSIDADVFPASIVKAKFAGAHFLHDVLIVLTVKGWIAGKKNVSDDTGRPNIAFA